MKRCLFRGKYSFSSPLNTSVNGGQLGPQNVQLTPLVLQITLQFTQSVACDFCVLVSLRSSAFVFSAGVGRTGTFMVVDSMLDRIKAENTLDIYNFVAYLRTRRTAMVQTEVCTAL